MKKVLFICHDASRSGAPIILLNLLKWFKANTDIPFLILLKIGGELEPEFEALAPVIALNRELYKRTLAEKVLLRLGFKVSIVQNNFYRLNKRLVQEDVSLIYANTITNGELLELLSNLKCHVITHVHELEYAIDSFGLDNFMQVKRHTQQYIAVAEAVKKNLVENHEIKANNINLIYEFISSPPPTPSIKFQESYHHIREQLNIPPDALIVGGSGTQNWRKGTDLFIQLARFVLQRQLNNPVHFVWVGGGNKETYFSELLYDIRHMGLENYVHFTGAQPNPLDYFSAFDVFTLVSREDPFPLVMLEAASVGKPIVCFDNSGGAKEFVEDDCGFVVPYLDIEAMADKVVKLMNSAELRQSLGQQAAQKVRQRHDITVAAPKIFELIKKFI